MNELEIITILKQMQIFYLFDEESLKKLVKNLTFKTYKKGEIIYNEGEEGRYLYILNSGRLRIDSKGKIINYLGRRGDFIGEHSLMTDSKHSVTVSAAMDTDVFILDKNYFNELISKYPGIGVYISRALGERLQEKFDEEKNKDKIIISIYSSGKKSGTSILAVNLAYGIKKDTARSVVLVDLCAEDAESSIATLLDLGISKEKLYILTGEVPLLSSNSLEKYIITDKNGMKVFNYVLSKNDIIPLLSLLQENHDCIVIDLPHKLTEISEKILEQSDKILFICTPYEETLTKSVNDIHYINNTLKIPIEKVRIGQVCIREEDRKNVSKVEKTLNRHIDFHLVFEPRGIRESIETGVPFVISHPSLLISQNIKNLIRDLTGEKVGIALGSGTARGFAHIGVLKVLKKEGIPIDLVAGTSMGAFLGSIFASGISPETMEKIAISKFTAKKSIFSILDLVIPKSGFMSGIRIVNFLKSIIGNPLFLDLKIPLAIVASELSSGEPVILRTGSVIEAVRASISFPGILEPYYQNNKFLIDGGITMPVPVKALKEMGAKKTLAVDVIPKVDRSDSINQRPKVFDVVFRTVEIMGAEIAKESAQGANVVIKPDVSSFSSLEFHRVSEIIKAGEDAAYKSIPYIKELLKK